MMCLPNITIWNVPVSTADCVGLHRNLNYSFLTQKHLYILKSKMSKGCGTFYKSSDTFLHSVKLLVINISICEGASLC